MVGGWLPHHSASLTRDVGCLRLALQLLQFSLCAVCPLTSISSLVSPSPWTFIPSPARPCLPGLPPTMASLSQLFFTPLIGLIPRQEN